MAVEILTKADLQQFKTDLFSELKVLLNAAAPTTQKKWLKSYQVREMLGISRGTLQHMKDSQKLNPTQLGGLLFYDYDEIQKLMQGKQKSKR